MPWREVGRSGPASSLREYCATERERNARLDRTIAELQKLNADQSSASSACAQGGQVPDVHVVPVRT